MQLLIIGLLLLKAFIHVLFISIYHCIDTSLDNIANYIARIKSSASKSVFLKLWFFGSLCTLGGPSRPPEVVPGI